MNRGKRWYNSRTILAAATIILISAIETTFNWTISDEDKTKIMELIDQVATPIIALIAIWGRYAATEKLR